MAEAEKENLLQTLTKQRLGDVPAPRESDVPARTDERGEPREPVEPRDTRDTEVGKRPEEVVAERETRPAPTPDDDGKKAKPKIKRWKVHGEELTLQQLEERGLLDKIITTASQLPAIQQKYQELLERNAGKEVKPGEPAKAELPAPPTQAEIRQAYNPMLQEMVREGYVEADFADAYPDLSTGLMYNRARIDQVEEKLIDVIEWIKAEVGMRNAVTVQTMLNQAVNAVAAKVDKDGKPDRFFEGLRNAETLQAFLGWLRKEVDPKVGSLTAENIEKFWLAYNASDLLSFTKEAAEKVVNPPPRKRAASDGSPSRPGTPETPKEKSLLERMSEIRLGPEA